MMNTDRLINIAITVAIVLAVLAVWTTLQPGDNPSSFAYGLAKGAMFLVFLRVVDKTIFRDVDFISEIRHANMPAAIVFGVIAYTLATIIGSI